MTGLSQGTVSTVLAGRGGANRIPEQTRQRVIAAARSLGYVPNASARSLQGMRNNLIGVHTFSPLFPPDQRTFYLGFLVGIEERAEETGNDLILFASTGDGGGQRSIYRDGANRLNLADGSILLGVPAERGGLARLLEDGYPFVHIGRRTVDGTEVPSIIPDYVEGLRDIVANLVALGHRKLAYLGIGRPQEPQVDRESGYRRALDEHGLASLPLRRPAGGQVSDGWVEKMVSAGVTALLTENVDLATAVVDRAARRGLRTPRDLSVVVLDDLSDDPALEARWSYLGVKRKAVGRRALDLLLHRLEGEPVKSEFVECVLPSTATIGPCPEQRL
jgi:DNA-binding LacI/PurR family transcriptional regulator